MAESTVPEPFNEAADVMHEAAISKGFYEPVSSEQGLIAVKLLLIVSEIIEHFEAIRKNHGSVKEAEELADVVIRLFDYAAWRGIDLDAEINAKMLINADRPHKHGANF
jgi:NTP pyrophosphatase (non-canonical NTP hydrolase)